MILWMRLWIDPWYHGCKFGWCMFYYGWGFGESMISWYIHQVYERFTFLTSLPTYGCFFSFQFCVRGGHKHLKVDLIFICPKVAKWGRHWPQHATPPPISCLLVIFVIKKNQTSAPKYSCFVSFSGCCSRQKKITTGFSDRQNNYF